MNRLFRRTGFGALGAVSDPKLQVFNLGVGTFGFALVSMSLGCSAPPPPPKVIPKAPLVVAAPPPPPPLPPARWMQVAGTTTIGPQIDGGTMMLVGGRRVLIGADGSSKTELAPSPEPLEQVVVIPTVGGTKRIIARGKHGIFRLDDPLGSPKPLAQSESEIRAIAAYVGLIVVWTYNSDTPRFIDVDTGKFKLVPTLPPLPMRTVAFRNDKEGAAIFEGVGVAVTTDGGSTWKRVTEDVNGDALRMQGLTVLNGSLFAYVFEEGFISPVDVTQARLGRATDRPVETNSPALVRWIRATGLDPIEAAASRGIESTEGTALVAHNGLIARVDLKTGAILGIEEFAREPGNELCTFQRAGNAAWLGCPVIDSSNSDVYSPFGIMRVSLDGNSFKPERPALVRSGEVELRTSPSGGVMLLGQCNGDGEGEVCSRQPDGRWINLAAEVELSSRAVGPLGDGRVAFLRNMWDGDKPETHVAGDEHEEESHPEENDEMGEDREDREDRVVPEGKRLYIAAVGEGRKEDRIATISWRPRGDVRVHSPIQEDSDHNLHFIISDDEGVYVIVQPIDKEARAPQRLEGMTEARLRGSRGIAVGAEGIRASTDGGRTWAGVPTPTAARNSLSQVDSMGTDASLFSVSEVGMLLDKTVRIGWGSVETIDDPLEPVFDSTLPSVSRLSAPEKLLTCSVEAIIPGTPPLTSSNLIVAALGKKTPAPKGTRRGSATGSSNRDGVMGTTVYFEEEGSDKPGALPSKWTFNWLDAMEVGGKARTWSGAPPKDIPWGAQVRDVASSGARAIFTIRVGIKNILVRTKASGGAEMVEVSSELLPSSDIVFGTEKGEPIVWAKGNSLIVWISGEAPRVIGQVGYRSTRLLGEPTKDGVPVLVSGQDWSAVRVFPIPALGKKDAPAPAVPAPTLDGWTAAPNLTMHVGRFGVCTTKPKNGQHFVLIRPYARASVDGGAGSLGSTRYGVYMSGTDVCVAQVAATYSSDRSLRPQTPPPANAPKKALMTFVRTDFLAKRAEGGTRGLPAKDAMNKLTCTLEERK